MPMNAVQIDVVDATVRFGTTTAFAGLDAHFPAARVTALVGPSGSGKSTLLAAISGYQSLGTGRVELRNSPTCPSSPPDPGRVAWVPQGSNALGRRSVLDNVAIAPLASGAPLREAHERAVEALEVVGLGALLHQQARRLSGGELQRVALARALASNKEVILADEPSANLDAANTDLIAQILDGLTARATIVVATHDPVLVAAAEVTVHMRDEALDAA
ncbi:ABC transporter ATP-binding protein [Pseudactinotalea sp. HY158]|uniref:ABC transporter ATP-binding protein n=1 Tax=Pseudactinotalea sp. HY158 TaxID=2654547 RepID=UPI00129C36DA|nr:ATP-binding cassette domain-containing protein [Pseudactinotalea sp. HY158]QGH69173.1 ATP-binding cassette domain-containing protein [Pseudactinotalea sp. HY158]